MSERPMEVRFSISDQDIRALRDYRPGRIRFPLLEWSLHALAAFVALAIMWFAMVTHRLHRLPVYLGVLASVWLAVWAWLVFVLFRRSPKSKAWFAGLRASPILTKGDCVASLPEAGVLQIMCSGGTQTITSAHVEDLVYSSTHFYLGTKAGQVVIIPRRAFASDEEFADFVRELPGPADDEAKR